MRLNQRLLVGFGVLMALLIGVGIIIALLANRTLVNFNQITQHAQPVSASVYQMRIRAAHLGAHVEEYLRTKTTESRELYLEDTQDFLGQLETYSELVANTSEAGLVDEIRTVFEAYQRFGILRMAANDVQAVIFVSASQGLDDLVQIIDSLHAAIPSDTPSNIQRSALLERLRAQLLNLNLLLSRYQSTPTEAIGTEIANLLQLAENTFNGYQITERSPLELAQMPRFERQFGWVITEVPYVEKLAGDIDRYSQEFFATMNRMDDLFESRVLAASAAESALASENATDSAIATQTILLFLVAGGIIVGLVTTYLITQHVVRSIDALKKGAEAIKGGNLSYRIASLGSDELADLAQSFNAMAEQEQANVQNLETARREAEHANRMKDLFMATMSHELRTPLNAMIGFLNLMMFSGQLNEDNLHMANRSLANSQRLLTLINNILDLSRIATGALQIIPNTINPREMSAALYNDMKIMAQDKGLQLELNVDPTLPDRIFNDGDRLMQIITNLMHNAIKFTEQGCIRLNLQRNGERMVISVSDTGIGIPKSKQHLIFDDFFQVDPSSTRQHQGAGLGLAIVKRLALMMGGSIHVQSEVNEGSTFTVEVPLNLPGRDSQTREFRSPVFTDAPANGKLPAPVTG